MLDKVGNVVQAGAASHGSTPGFLDGIIHAQASLVELGQGGCNFQLISWLGYSIGGVQPHLYKAWQNWPLVFDLVGQDKPWPSFGHHVPQWVTLGDLKSLAWLWPLASMGYGPEKCSGVGATEGKVASEK